MCPWRMISMLPLWLLLAAFAWAQAPQVPVERDSHAPVVLSTRSIAAPTLPQTTLHPVLPRASTGPKSLSFNLSTSGHFQAQPLNTTHPMYLPVFAPPPMFPTRQHPTLGALTSAGPRELSLPSSAYVAPPPGSRVSHGASWIMLDVGSLRDPLPRQGHPTLRE
jgi:hypothetical protein